MIHEFNGHSITHINKSREEIKMITKWLETAKKGHSGNKDMESKKHLGVLLVGV